MQTAIAMPSSRREKQDPPPENRVGGFWNDTCSRTGSIWSQALETYRETGSTTTTTVSGVVEWLSNDPIGISGGLNQFVAFGNNPVMFRDPLGLDARIIWEHFLQKGHAQIAVDVYDSTGNVVGEKAYGFRPTDVSFKYPKVLLGIDIPGIAQEESRIPGPEQIDNMPLSPTATRELQKIIEKNLGTEPYDMYDKNCIHWINRILEEAIERFNKMNEECPK